MSNIPTLSMKRRLKYVVVVAVVLAFCVLVGSLVNISVLNYDVYTGYANRNQLRPTTIAPTRGTIYDRNMGILAQSATVWDVIMSPVSINSEEKDGGIHPPYPDTLETAASRSSSWSRGCPTCWSWTRKR